jgi:hypothetical protein
MDNPTRSGLKARLIVNNPTELSNNSFPRCRYNIITGTNRFIIPHLEFDEIPGRKDARTSEKLFLHATSNFLLYKL